MTTAARIHGGHGWARLEFGTLEQDLGQSVRHFEFGTTAEVLVETIREGRNGAEYRVAVTMGSIGLADAEFYRKRLAALQAAVTAAEALESVDNPVETAHACTPRVAGVPVANWNAWGRIHRAQRCACGQALRGN